MHTNELLQTSEMQIKHSFNSIYKTSLDASLQRGNSVPLIGAFGRTCRQHPRKSLAETLLLSP